MKKFTFFYRLAAMLLAGMVCMPTWAAPEKQSMNMHFDNEEYVATFPCGEFESPQVQTEPEGLPVRYFIDYTESQDTVAEINSETGEVTILAPGSAIIVAAFDGNDEYEENAVTYVLAIEQSAVTEPSLSFDSEEDYAQLGVPYEGLALNNPEQLEVVWSSADTTVAVVDNQGNVTIIGLGSTIIQVDYEGSECYSEAHVNYTLNVEEPQLMLHVLGREVTLQNAEDILEDGGSASYNVETRTLMLTNLVVDVQDEPNLDGPIVEDQGEVGGKLNLAIVGRCEFRNAEIAFSHAIGVRIFGDTLICSGTGPQIYADNVVVDGAYVHLTASADEQTPVLHAEALSVLNDGYLFVKTNRDTAGLAIYANELTMDENIAILTEGVEFYADPEFTASGFFMDADHSVHAREVEIGPVTVELPIDLSVCGVEVTKENAADILGNGKAVYDIEHRILTFNNLEMDFENSEFMTKGGALVEDRNVQDIMGPLLVVINGRCSFTNTYLGFAGELGFNFGTEEKGELYLSGQMTQIQANEVTIDGVDITAIASFGSNTPAVSAWQSMTIVENGHLLAKNTNNGSSDDPLGGIGAETQMLVIDENMAILTEGVHFFEDPDHERGGFFTDEANSVYAREVEIGPAAVELPIDLSVCGVEVTKENAADILGNGKAVYDIEHRILTFNNLEMDFENSEFMTEGGALVEDRNVQDIMGPLLVVINGRCSFTNTYLGFAGELGFNFGTEEKGELYLSGQMTQIQANEVTIDGVDITAIASFGSNTPAVSAWQSMTIVENGHLLAKNTNNGSSDDPLGGIGAETQMLVIDENMAILTKGVHHFEDPDHERGGFFTDEANSVYAREVEIGPKPVVVADDEVTTIDFTKTNPDGSEEVVVSLGANDSFNETTGQLEISTSLTDEQVEEALENLVPGSGAFAAALPGSITFDIPAGEGSIDIQCVTLPGYTLQVKIEGQAAISLTQTTFGWAHVDYKVAVPVHVVLYLHANANPMPARVRADNPSAALCIQAIRITPSGASESIEEIIQTTSEGTQKVLFDGQLYIVRDGKVFNAQGTEIR